MTNIHPQLQPLAVPIDSLTPDPTNAREHGEKNIGAIRSSLRKFGQRKPIVVQRSGDQRIVRAGNGTVEAAKAEGWTEIASVVIDEGDKEAMAFALADNRTAELAKWSIERLVPQLDDFHPDVADGLPFDMLDLGFDLKDHKTLVAHLDRTRAIEEEKAAEKSDGPPVTRPGDLIILGEHRLLCGDATNADDVARLLDGAKPEMMVTDPPYGVNYDPSWRTEAARKGGLGWAPRRTGKVENDDRASWLDAWTLFPGDVAYVWHGALFADVVKHDLEACKFETRNQIIWVKKFTPLSRGNYNWKHETCWYAVRKGRSAGWVGDAKQDTVWVEGAPIDPLGTKDDAGEDYTFHGTQKPGNLMKRAIQNHTGDVYDPFVGSGTTLIVAEQLQRRCFAIDIDSAYCDVVVKRWESLTGRKADRPNREEAPNGEGDGEAASDDPRGDSEGAGSR